METSGPATKRPKMDAPSPSAVVMLDKLAPNTVEYEIRDGLSKYGEIVDVLVLPTYASASVQFAGLESAQACYEAAGAEQLEVGGTKVTARYSLKNEIVRRSQMESNEPSAVLVLGINEVYYPVNADLVKKVCEAHGEVHRIAVLLRGQQENCTALVQMSSVEDARQVKLMLNGADIYPGACRLKVSYSKNTEVTITEQNEMQQDYITPEAVPAAPPKSASILAPPPLPQQQAPPAPTGPQDNQWQGGMGGMSFGNGGGGGNLGYPGNKNMGWGEEQSWCDDGYQDDGYGGQGGMWGGDEGYGEAGYGGYGDGGYGGYGETYSQVLLVHNADTNHVNCDGLFNILCAYGNVARIKFLRNKENTAMVEFSDPESAQRALMHLHECPMFGKKLVIFPCKAGLVTTVVPNKDGDTLPDGSPVFKDYSNSRENRFLNAKKAAKNRIAFPNNVIHWWNLPATITEEQVKQVFTSNGAAEPIRVNLFNRGEKTGGFSTGLAMYSSSREAAEAMVLVNHGSVPGDIPGALLENGHPLLVKMNFSNTAEGDGWGGGGGGGRGRGRGRGRGGGGGGGFGGGGGGGFQGKVSVVPPKPLDGQFGQFGANPRGGRGGARGRGGPGRGGRGGGRGRGGPGARGRGFGFSYPKN